jgi:hypothetical protein
MRWMLPLLLLALSGCGVPLWQPVGAFAAAEMGSVMVFGRGMGDLVYSGITGRDCSIVRLEQGKTYCKPTEPSPTVPPLCTRSLGIVDCWSNPAALNGPAPRGLADGPRTLTPAQEADRTARWPKF